MAVSIGELIAQKDELKAKRGEKYEVETSIGTLIMKQPSAALIEELVTMYGRMSDQYLILKCCVVPNLHDRELQAAYECAEPTDIVDRLFKIGEARTIAGKLMNKAGYDSNVTLKVHRELKN